MLQRAASYSTVSTVKSPQSVEAEVQVGISAELQRILQDVDGQSRSVLRERMALCF